MPELTAEILMSQHSDAIWRERFLDATGLVTLLRQSVISAKYRVSDELNELIKLTEAGQAAHRQLVSKHDTPPKEARLMCFLEMGRDEAWVDLTRLDLDAIRQEVSEQIREGRLLHPFIFGRRLYDRAADIFPDVRRQLDHEETMRLLDDTPPGVFQVGHYVTGPFGLMRSREHRVFPPTLDIRLQHCHDASCRRVHSTRLSTSYDAPINQHLGKLHKAFSYDSSVDEAWARFAWAVDTNRQESDRYADFHKGAVPIMLGDCFSRDELLELAQGLCDVSEVDDPRAIELLKRGEGDSQQCTLLEAELLQIIWSCADEAISTVLDRLIEEGAIRVPPGDHRRPVVTGYALGPFSLGAEFSMYGSRVISDDHNMAQLRLRSLIYALYNLNDRTERAEVDWLLRAVDGRDAEERIERFVWNQAPWQVLEVLVMARRANISTALERLQITHRRGYAAVEETGNDADFIRYLLWKLGFRWSPPPRTLTQFNRHADATRNLLGASDASALFDLERLRGAAASFFVELERVLREACEFSWWALCTDHFAADRPFTYFDGAGADAWKVLHTYNETCPASDQRLLLYPDARRTLYPLTQASRVLADYLDSLRAANDSHLRSPSEMPRYVGKTDLRKFPFQHRYAFLDLTPVAQGILVDTLREGSRKLKDSYVSRIRNDLAHYQRSELDLAQAREAIDTAVGVVHLFEKRGVIPTTYRLAKHERDPWGRSQVTFIGPLNEELLLARPSVFQRSGLPYLTQDQLIMPSALFAPQEMLRFSDSAESTFSQMWRNFPRRREDWQRHLRTAEPNEADVIHSAR
jgi:hypothetical protein